MRARLVIAIAMLAVVSVASAAEGTTFEMTVKDVRNDTTQQMRMAIQSDRLRVDTDITANQPRTSVIFRGDRQETILLDHPKRQAIVMDWPSIEQMAAQMRQARKQMEQAMANMPAEQRKMMEGMMKGKMEQMMPEAAAPVDVRKTSETTTVAGYPCVKYEVYQGGKKVREHLVTDWSNLKIDESTFDVFKEMAKFFDKLAESFGSDMAAMAQNPFEETNALDGFPVVTRDFEGGTLLTETTLTAVTTGDVAGDLFENPGYPVQKPEIPTAP